MNKFRAHFAGRSDKLFLPSDDKDQIDGYVAKQSARQSDVERMPFPRQLDFWAFSICVALAKGFEPRKGDVSRWGVGFVNLQSGLSIDEDVFSLLAIVAMAKMGHESPDVDNPRKIIELANRLAGAGSPFVLSALSSNSLRTTPLDRVVSLARSLTGRSRC